VTDLQSRLGERAGAWLHRRVRGIDDSVVTPREVQKQVSREETFGRDLHDDDLLERELLRLAVRVSTDLRRQGLRARTVTVKLKDADFTTRSAQRTLAQPIESEKSVIKAARVLYRALRGKRRVGVRLLGIGLSHFDDDGGTGPAVQLGFFAAPPPPLTEGEPVENAKDRALTRALDRIRDRYGSTAIIPARLVDQASDTGPRVEE
jgi:DNA polymerase-4